MSDETMREITILFRNLWTLEPEKDEQGDERPTDLPVTSDAKKEFITFVNRHGEEAEELTGDEASAWSKLEAYAGRLALIIHLVRWATGAASPDEVDVESIRAGVTIVEWFKHEVRRVYASLAETDEERTRRELRELIDRKRGRITVRQLMQASRRYRGNADLAEGALEGLVKVGWGHWIVDTHNGGPGRPTKVFQLFQAGNTTTARPGKDEDVLPLPAIR